MSAKKTAAAPPLPKATIEQARFCIRWAPYVLTAELIRRVLQITQEAGSNVNSPDENGRTVSVDLALAEKLRPNTISTIYGIVNSRRNHLNTPYVPPGAARRGPAAPAPPAPAAPKAKAKASPRKQKAAAASPPSSSPAANKASKQGPPKGKAVR